MKKTKKIEFIDTGKVERFNRSSNKRKKKFLEVDSDEGMTFQLDSAVHRGSGDAASSASAAAELITFVGASTAAHESEQHQGWQIPMQRRRRVSLQEPGETRPTPTTDRLQPTPGRPTLIRPEEPAVPSITIDPEVRSDHCDESDDDVGAGDLAEPEHGYYSFVSESSNKQFSCAINVIDQNWGCQKIHL